MGDPAKDALAAVTAAQERQGGEAVSPVVTDFTKPLTRWSLDLVEPSTGTRYTGSFVSRIPKGTERLNHYIAMGRMAAGAPWSSIPPAGRELIDMLLAFETRLVEKPEWFKPDAFFDDFVLLRVYAKILEHEDGFFRRGPGGARGPQAAPVPDGTNPPVVRGAVPAPDLRRE